MNDWGFSPGDVQNLPAANYFFGPTSIPKSSPMLRYQVSSSLACKSTDSSSLILPRHCRKGTASGPTGCRSCQVPLWAISKIFSATSDGGAGFFSAAMKREAKRAPWRYAE